MNTENESTMNAESIAYLEEVKKGKPRKFVMICKGPQVVSLVVYKKGNVEKRKKEAKEVGKGQVYFGVVQGKGVDMRFVLARSDGFENAPVKTPVLKGFLDESAGLKVKPQFEIVDSPPLALDDSDPLVQRFLELQPQATTAASVHPDRAEAINVHLKDIPAWLDGEQTDLATEGLDRLESLLKELLSDGGATDEAQAYAATLQTVTADLPRLKSINEDVGERLGKVLESVKHSADKGDLKTALNQLMKMTEVIAKALSANRSQEAAQVVPADTVKSMVARFEQARTRWDAALVAARDRIRPVQDSIREELPNTAQGLTNILDSYEKDLTETLLAGQVAAGQRGLEQAVQDTLAKLNLLRAEAASDNVFTYLDECGISVTAVFQDAFVEVESLLQT